MAYDEDLANRIREALADHDAVTGKKMFGGLAFLVDEHMAVAASRSGGVLVRVNPADSDELIAADGVERMVMGGREMHAWLHVAPEVVEADSDLTDWVQRGVAAAAEAT